MCDEVGVGGLLVVVLVGLYGVVLVDGFEYCGYYGLFVVVLMKWYLLWFEVLVDVGVDMFVLEIIFDIDEVEVLVNLVWWLVMLVWFSYMINGMWICVG